MLETWSCPTGGKRGVIPVTALRFERLFMMDADVGLTIQPHRDLWQAKHRAEAKQVQKIRSMKLDWPRLKPPEPPHPVEPVAPAGNSGQG